MRTVTGISALALVAVLATACSGGASPSASSSTAATAAAASESAAASVAPSQVAAACTFDSLQTKTPGTLTIGADNPAYPPYYQPSDPATDPWELGDPTNRQGFEGRVAWAIARNLGFVGDTVKWVVAPFNTAIGPGAKDFDIYLTQASYSAERAQAVDMTDGYYDVAQAVVGAKDSKLSKVTTIAGLKDFQFGAQVGTTSLDTITKVIAPSKEAKVYDTNDLAVEALKNGQIDGLVVDLPTAFYVTAAQFDGGVIVGQFPAPEGGEHFSVVLDKDSPLTACVNTAIGQLRDSGELARITQQELSDNAGAPVFKP
ncbi:MAG TPA: ABC transporter substrate-binding protein [Candidatus Limnocylindrales bacterium]|jgi:polar amino acid transport system substrate-binding protein